MPAVAIAQLLTMWNARWQHMLDLLPLALIGWLQPGAGVATAAARSVSIMSHSQHTELQIMRMMHVLYVNHAELMKVSRVQSADWHA